MSEKMSREEYLDYLKKPQKRKKMKGSADNELLMIAAQKSLEEVFDNVLTEFSFHPERDYRFDFAVPALKIAFEIEGGHWAGGRHSKGKGFESDIEKYNYAALAGWKVLRTTYTQIKSGYFSRIVAQAKRAATA